MVCAKKSEADPFQHFLQFLGLKSSWPVAATMPIEVMEEFAREGWIGLGWQIGRDSMHFQPTR
jgi:hypothetical protein